MEETFALDYLRQCIIQTIYKNYIESNESANIIGNPNQISLVSFYEHLQSGDQVDRFVDTVKDLLNQQNRMGLIANGVIVAPSTPAITNINQKKIIPLEFNVSFRTTLEDRDLVLNTLNLMVDKLKGRKRDVALFDNGKVFMVGSVANNSIGTPVLSYGDYLGSYDNNVPDTIVSLNDYVVYKLNLFSSLGIIEETYPETLERYYYVGIQYEDNGVLRERLAVVIYDSDTTEWKEIIDDGTHPTIIFPPTHNYFEKYKVSMSFETNRVSEPRTLNANDMCNITLGGSTTVCSSSVKLGNDLTKLDIMRNYVYNGGTKVLFNVNNEHNYLEPLEIPNSSNLNSIPNQLASNNFMTNSHNDAISSGIQYTFIIDEDIELLNHLFRYARYGKVAILTSGDQLGISPNVVYTVKEYWVKWGNVKIEDYLGKIIGDIDVDSTESDVMTISITMQVQGEND